MLDQYGVRAIVVISANPVIWNFVMRKRLKRSCCKAAPVHAAGATSKLHPSQQHPTDLASSIQPGVLMTTLTALQCIQLSMMLGVTHPHPDPRPPVHIQQQSASAEMLTATISAGHSSLIIPKGHKVH